MLYQSNGCANGVIPLVFLSSSNAHNKLCLQSLRLKYSKRVDAALGLGKT